ncbi:hypothetical protein WAF17_02165 [Bernardetia sp. ABR2-2B]|uniref:hypothetical protein n=1 Tax=Bernardetia sp. ABR2-2B TaxID=3127472 RepID=UPI0030CF03A5
MEFTYKEIKESYLEIKVFLERGTNKSIILSATIDNELGFWGADNVFLLEEYFEKYKVSYENFDYDKHFYSEVWSLKELFLLLIFPFIILIHTIIYFFPKIRRVFKFILGEQKTHLTFGDLVASKLKGEFCLKADANIQLKK